MNLNNHIKKPSVVFNVWAISYPTALQMNNESM